MFKSARRLSALSVAAVALSVIALPASPAFAYDDSFPASTPTGAGVANFVDSGTWPGGGSNDDFVVIHDYASDGYGVAAYLWIDRNVPNDTDWRYLGWKVNKNGLAGAAVYWEIPEGGNIYPNQGVKLKVCLLDRNGNTPESTCRERYHYSVDG